jgi:hypothetical protein
MKTYAELSTPEIDGLIRGEQMLLDMQKRETDHVSPPMVAAYKRIALLEAEKLHRKGSGFGRPPEVRRP